MKKSVFLIIITISLFLLISFVSAAENETITVEEETKKEIKDMEVNHGARMRMLQLRFEIERRILWGENVVEYLKGKNNTNSTINVTELEGILVQLRILADETKNITFENKEGAIKKFIEIKKDAKDLVREFKEKAREMLTEQDKNALRMKFDEIDRAKLQELKEEIKKERRALNAEHAKKILESVGVTDEQLVIKIENGEVSAAEVKTRLREDYGKLTDEQKAQVKTRIRNEANARLELAKNHTTNYEKEFKIRNAARLKATEESLKRLGTAEIKNRLKKVRDKINATSSTGGGNAG